MKRFGILLTLTILAGNGLAHGAGLDPATATANDLFGITKVYTFHLTISAADFQKMPPKGRGGFGRGFPGGFDPFDDDRYTKVPAKLEFDGKEWGTLMVRYKGNSSYGASPTELKRSLKLDFDDPDKTRTFFGLTKLNLNNNAFDSSQMREALAYDLFRRSGVDASRTAYAKVYITVPGRHKAEYGGLFTIVEQIDQTFFKERSGKKAGVLLKPERLNGMPYLGEDWKAYESRYISKVTAKPDDAARFIAFVKFMNNATDEEFAKRVGDYMDVDQFLRFLAAEVILVNTDSPLAMNHNYWLSVHPTTHKVIWIPWDMNMAFGGFMTGDQDLSIHKPSATGMFPLADRVLRLPGMVQRYDRIVREMVTTNFTLKQQQDQMQRIAAAIRDAIAAEKTGSIATFERNLTRDPSTGGNGADRDFAAPDFGAFRGPRGFGPRGGGPPLLQFLAGRIESVIAQLDGKREGTPGMGRGRGGPFPGGGFPPPGRRGGPPPGPRI